MMLLNYETKLFVTQFVVEKLLKDFPLDHKKFAVQQVMKELSSNQLNLSQYYGLVRQHLMALKIQPLDSSLLKDLNGCWLNEVVFTPQELKGSLVPDHLLRWFAAYHEMGLSPSFKKLLIEKESELQFQFSEWLAIRFLDTIGKKEFLAWTESMVEQYASEMVQNKELEESVKLDSNKITLDRIQGVFDSFYQSLIETLVGCQINDPKFKGCSLTANEFQQLSQTHIPSAEKWLTELFLKTNRYQLDEEGVLREDRSYLIMNTFKKIVDLVRMNAYTAFEPDIHILEQVERLVSLMYESEEGYTYYFKFLMEEVKKVNYDVTLLETMSLVVQLKAKREFYDSLKL